MKLFGMFLTAVLINNIVLTKFLGMCPFLGVSKKTSSAIGMGFAVTFVIVIASIFTYFVHYYVLVPLDIEYMQLITFILIIASFVQLTEMIIKKYSPALYKALGVYLPLITTNCAVLYVAQNNISQAYSFVEMLVSALGISLGFVFVLYIFSAIRERLEASSIPKYFQGNPISLIVAAIMAIAFMGFGGLM